MTSDKATKYCNENPLLIEGYKDAHEDITQTWKVMHRYEFTSPLGRIPPMVLKQLGLWMDRPASELKFVTKDEYAQLVKKTKRVPKCLHLAHYLRILLAVGRDIDTLTTEQFKKDVATITRLRDIFKTVKYACYNQNSRGYNFYGGKGIYICDEWLDDNDTFIVWAMRQGYEAKNKRAEVHIFRRDRFKGYTPDNCVVVAHLEDVLVK